MKKLNKKQKTIITSMLISLVVGIGLVISRSKDVEVNPILIENKDKLDVDIEYGDEVELWIPEGFEGDNKYKAEDLGEHTVEKEYERDSEKLLVEYSVYVSDTKNPVITGAEDIEVTLGDKVELNKLGIKASDPVDGDLEVKFDGKVEEQVGTYEITATTEDKNGNKTSVKFNINVKEAEVDKPTSSGDNSNSSAGKNTGSSNRPSDGSSSGSSSQPKPQPKPKPKPNPQPKPEPKPQPKPEASKPISRQDLVNEFHNATNKERQARGLKPLQLNDKLNNYASIRSKEIITHYSHTRPNGEDFRSLEPFFINGENIVAGNYTPAQAVKAFMDSPGHRDIILTPDLKYVGYGITSVGNRMYFVQLFSYGI